MNVFINTYRGVDVFPKIISNVREQLVAEARQQVMQAGYTATTIRSVSSGCGIAIGTVYNYFSSKDMLIAAFMLEDWECALSHAKNELFSAVDGKSVLSLIYSELLRFIDSHRVLFDDANAVKAQAEMFSDKHPVFRSQVAALMLPFMHIDSFTADFIAEALITWASSETPFDQLYSVLQKLI